MNRIKGVVIAMLFVFIACVFTACGNNNTGETMLVNTLNFDVDFIENINIDYDEETVTFLNSDSDQFIIKEYMNEDNKKYYARVKEEGDNISIMEGERPKNPAFTCYVEVYLPEKYEESITVHVTSGAIYSDLDISLNKFYSDTTSGTIILNNLISDDVKLSTTSGTIECHSLNPLSSDNTVLVETTSGIIQISEIGSIDPISEITLKSTSGTIKSEEAYAGKMHIETNSAYVGFDKLEATVNFRATHGNLYVGEFIGSGNFESSAEGHIDLDIYGLMEDITIFSKGGEVAVNVSDAASFQYFLKTKSGIIHPPFGNDMGSSEEAASGTVGENPEFDISIETNSGGIQLNSLSNE